jgi:hypothetical protein
VEVSVVMGLTVLEVLVAVVLLGEMDMPIQVAVVVVKLVAVQV